MSGRRTIATQVIFQFFFSSHWLLKDLILFPYFNLHAKLPSFGWSFTWMTSLFVFGFIIWLILYSFYPTCMMILQFLLSFTCMHGSFVWFVDIFQHSILLPKTNTNNINSLTIINKQTNKSDLELIIVHILALITPPN